MDRSDVKGSKPQLELYAQDVVDNRDASTTYRFTLVQGIYIYDDPEYPSEISYEVRIDDEYCAESHEDLDDAISAFNRLVRLYGER